MATRYHAVNPNRRAQARATIGPCRGPSQDHGDRDGKQFCDDEGFEDDEVDESIDFEYDGAKSIEVEEKGKHCCYVISRISANHTIGQVQDGEYVSVAEDGVVEKDQAQGGEYVNATKDDVVEEVKEHTPAPPVDDEPTPAEHTGKTQLPLTAAAPDAVPAFEENLRGELKRFLEQFKEDEEDERPAKIQKTIAFPLRSFVHNGYVYIPVQPFEGEAEESDTIPASDESEDSSVYNKPERDDPPVYYQLFTDRLELEKPDCRVAHHEIDYVVRESNRVDYQAWLFQCAKDKMMKKEDEEAKEKQKKEEGDTKVPSA